MPKSKEGNKRKPPAGRLAVSKELKEYSAMVMIGVEVLEFGRKSVL